jgi:hypothetical protein
MVDASRAMMRSTRMRRLDCGPIAASALCVTAVTQQRIRPQDFYQSACFRSTIGVIRPKKQMQPEITKLLSNHHKAALKNVCCSAE